MVLEKDKRPDIEVLLHLLSDPGRAVVLVLFRQLCIEITRGLQALMKGSLV